MNTGLIAKIEAPFLRKDLPNFKVGDTVEVSTIIREGGRTRSQLFRGLVIAIRGSGTRKLFTVRKISYGIGVEKSFPLLSKNIETITVIKPGKVRRAKLYYLRERVGKLALKVRPGQPAPVIEYGEESQDVLEAEGKVELAEVKSDAEMEADVKAAEAVEAKANADNGEAAEATETESDKEDK
jgi:large subunit ribosomal protein L19